MSVLRRTMLSGLATTVQTNVRRGAQAAQFFEVDRLFHRVDATTQGEVVMAGRWHVAGIAGGQLQRSNWRSDGTQVDFFTLKGIVEDLLEKIGARDIAFQPVDRPPFVSGTAAQVSRLNEPPYGFIGEIDPKLVAFERVPFHVFAFELDLEALEDAFKTLPVYHQLLRQPAVARDLAVVVRIGIAYAEIVDTIRSAAGPRLEIVRLVDQYQGSQVPAGKQSLAFHMLYRDPERTLTAEEVAETMDKVVIAVKDRFGAELRG
jgi:phenylalanyl-tRNA synthetase beta chain